MAAPQTALTLTFTAREKEILKEIRHVIKELAPPATSSNENVLERDYQAICARVKPHLVEYEGTGPGLDTLAGIALHVAPKERAVAEVILLYTTARGVRPSATNAQAMAANEYAYGVGGLQLVALQYHEHRHEAATKSLDHIWTHFRTHNAHLDRRDCDRHAQLFDVYLLLMARATFLFSKHLSNLSGPLSEETLRHLSQMTAHKLVLDEETYSVVAILKALAQIEDGRIEDAYTTVQRHSLQERALHEISAVKSSLNDTDFSNNRGATSPHQPHRRGSTISPHSPHTACGPAHHPQASPHSGSGVTSLHVTGHQAAKQSPSPKPGAGATVSPAGGRKRAEPSADGAHCIFSLCHDLHIYLAVKLSKLAEARELFEEFKNDYNRGPKFDAFAKQLTTDGNVIKDCQEFLHDWTLDLEHLRKFIADVLC